MHMPAGNKRARRSKRYYRVEKLFRGANERKISPVTAGKIGPFRYACPFYRTVKPGTGPGERAEQKPNKDPRSRKAPQRAVKRQRGGKK